MKIICLQENLEKTLSFVHRTTTVKTQLPITTNVLLKATKKEIGVVGTDLENTIQIPLAGKTETEGGILIPTKTLIEVVSALPKEQVVITTEGLVVTVKSGRYEVKINGIAEDEFPQPPPVKKEKKREITELLTQVKTVSFAAAMDESRAVLTGVLLFFEKDATTLVATDGFRLSLKRVKNERGKEEQRLKIPSRILLEVAKIATEKAGEIDGDKENFLVVEENGNQAAFLIGDITILTRLIEGDFPAYEKIIPQSFDTKIIFDKDEFLQAVKLSSVFAREAANIVRLSIGKKGAILSANAPQVGENACEVEATLEGDENEIAFNSRFLLEFLGSVDAKELAFEMTGPLNPGVFKIPGDDSYLHIIMPVRVQG